MPSGAHAPQRLLEPGCRQSLVTPIDWKLDGMNICLVLWYFRRQSLVTPIDWKRNPCRQPKKQYWQCRQSLVTPIDWKLFLGEN